MTHTTDSNQPDTSERRPVTAPKKKLIETSLPLEVINAETARESNVRHSKPATLHHYWARRPHVNTRAVLFAQLVDDPSSRPDEFPTQESQDVERARLHALMQRLVVWENSNDESLLAQARHEIRRSNEGQLPALLDPFAGGGAIPLEAQRLGLEAHASDLNPLAVLINKALVEIPPKFAGRPPVFPYAAETRTGWRRMEGLAEDVARYGDWMRNQARKQIGDLYPAITAPGGAEHPVIAWIWARTVRSPNPANPIEVPLVRSWWLCKKKGKEAWVHASVVDGEVRYEVRNDAHGPKGDDDGTVGRQGALSIADGTPIDLKYIRAEAKAGRMGTRLIAVVGEAPRGRVYASPDAYHEAAASVASPDGAPTAELPTVAPSFRVQAYGFELWADLFTNRQLVALTTLSDLVSEVRTKVLADALEAGMSTGDRLEDGGVGAEAYADAVATYLAMAVDKLADLNNSLTRWSQTAQCPLQLFSRHAVPMVWDFPESNPLGSASGSFTVILDGFARAMTGNLFSPADTPAGTVRQADAMTRNYTGLAVSTDPPYYDNIGYSDLSDFFYVWLRRSLSSIHSKTVATMLTPKAEELVANPYRHDGREGAQEFFIKGFNSVFARIRETAKLTLPLTVYYAYKQQDASGDGTSSTGWHTLLDGLIEAGWEVTATWPMRTERSARIISFGTNALASSIVLACRPRAEDAPATTRRAFVAALKSELPESLRRLIQGSIAPVDLAQAAIGPGISVFSRYSRVREADGSDMGVKDALLLINSTLDEVIGEQESDFDPDTRFAVKWYRQYGWGQENSGIADQLARSSDTSVSALERGAIFEAKGGKARLLAPGQLEGTWDPTTDERVSVWEATVRLAAVMAKDGADKVAELLPSVQTRVNLDAVKELGFLLFHEAEKKKDTKDAILFNGLVSAWGDVNEQARKYASTPRASQQAFDFDEDED